MAGASSSVPGIGAATLGFGAAFWSGVFGDDGGAGAAAHHTAAYGPRGRPDAHGIRLPEGIWFDTGVVYLATTADSRIHAYDTRRERFTVLYDGLESPRAPLSQVDNITASRAGELFICEDTPIDEIHIGVMTRDRRVSRFLGVTGPNHHGCELSPRGDRIYFSSQRAHDEKGEVYEVSGPFRGRRRAG